MPLTARTRELVDGLARELAATFAAATGFGSPATSLVPELAEPPAWWLSIALSGAGSGQIVLGIDAAGARDVTKAIMGFDDEPPEEAIVDTLRELGSQAVGTVGQDPVNKGIRFDVALERGADAAPMDAVLYELSCGTQRTIGVAGWGEVADAAMVEALVPEPSLPGEALTETTAISGAPTNLDVILDVDLPISVRFGVTEMTLQALTRIGPGSVIDLARSPDDPVELLISGKVVARGEVVVVMGNYGVRITEVVSTADRIRSMGA